MIITENESSLNLDLAIDMLSNLILQFLKNETKPALNKPNNIIMFHKPTRVLKLSRISYLDWKEIVRIEEAEMFEYLDKELTLEALKDEAA